MTPEKRKSLIESYAATVVDHMDVKTLTLFAQDCLEKNLEDLSDDELLGEIQDLYPELLED